MFRLKRCLVNLGFLLLLLSGSSLVVFADGGHGNEDASFTMLPLILGIGAAVVVSGGAYATDNKRYKSVQLATLGLTVTTGILHLVIGIGGDTLLGFNGVGYLALAIALFLPIGLPSNTTRPLLLGLGIYTLITIMGYFLLHTPAQYTMVALLTKALELFLLISVGLQLRQWQSA